MEREKLMVAVDFGTTYSGIAFCHSNQKELNDIEVVTSWSNNGVAPKVPTEIRYVPGRDPRWGAEASVACERRQTANSAIIYNRFKLLLDVRGGSGLYRDRTSGSDDKIRLPAGKSPINIATDYLRLLYEELMEKILRRRIPETLDITPIHFIFTVPAIWGHQAQQATKMAAKLAGFCSRESDTLSLVSEPEAAALYVLKAMHAANFSRISTQATPALKTGDTFVICDAGGGTVDLISYEVEEVQPSFKLREAAVGTGAKCGSSYIDQAFLELLRQKLGPEFDDEQIWNKKDIGRGSNLMKTFDLIKRSFGQTTNDMWFIELPVNVANDEENGIYDNELEFTAEELQGLFDPVVERIVRLVQDQVQCINNTGKVVSAIFLVGGFGESHYLYQSLVEWANQYHISLPVINPRESWSAIMRGAIVRELHPAVRSRRLRQHYGFSCNSHYDPRKHKLRDTYMSPFGGRRVKNTIKWGGHLGDDCTETTDIVFPVHWTIDGSKTRIRCKLYASKAVHAPGYLTDLSVFSIGTIYTDISTVNFAELPCAYDEDGDLVYRFDTEVRMRLASADVSFSIWRNDKRIGNATITHET
ncbi:hypothetical protein TWF970_003044 [Orbilia oligospora]|uniref:Actin-like ATPase domain-containing protein n=1 Tax=Orbilia oligospora TaxID=2813651 RepID=A0A7C8RLY8_ORBOL|nr:hypothetical protein TWF970_003044 [Orbilia oligospora]